MLEHISQQAEARMHKNHRTIAVLLDEVVGTSH